MPKLAWDRIFQTCITANNDAILVVGYPIFLRAKWGLRPFLIHALTANDIVSMIDEIAPPPKDRWEFAGGYMFDTKFGENYRFRIVVAGIQESPSVILTRLSFFAPRLPLSNDEAKWNSVDPAQSYESILAWCGKGERRDAILVPKCAPLIWSDSAIHVLYVPELSSIEISSLVANKIKRLGIARKGESYPSFNIAQGNHRYCAAVFGDREPILVALMRLPTDIPITIRKLNARKLRDFCLQGIRVRAMLYIMSDSQLRRILAEIPCAREFHPVYRLPVSCSTFSRSATPIRTA